MLLADPDHGAAHSVSLVVCKVWRRVAFGIFWDLWGWAQGWLRHCVAHVARLGRGKLGRCDDSPTGCQAVFACEPSTVETDSGSLRFRARSRTSSRWPGLRATELLRVVWLPGRGFILRRRDDRKLALPKLIRTASGSCGSTSYHIWSTWHGHFMAFSCSQCVFGFKAMTSLVRMECMGGRGT